MPGMNNIGRRAAFTLVEVVLTIAIVSVTGIAIIAAIAYGVQIEEQIHERNGATRVAADLLESTKKTLFQKLESKTMNDVPIYDRGTPETTDDVKGTVTLQFYDTAGNKVGTDANPIPLDLSMLRADVRVTWNPAGRRHNDAQTVQIQTLLAP